MKDWTHASFEYLVDLCWHTNDHIGENFKATSGLISNQIDEFCDTQQGTDGFGKWLNETQTELYEHYKCNTNYSKCTKHEIALR